jgi:hypothetical protein
MIPKSVVSAMVKAERLTLASASTLVTSASRPGLFSTKTEICFNINTSYSFRLSMTRTAFPSLRWIDFGSTSLTLAATPNAEARASFIFCSIF